MSDILVTFLQAGPADLALPPHDFAVEDVGALKSAGGSKPVSGGYISRSISGISDAMSGKMKSGFGTDGASSMLRRLIQAIVKPSGLPPTMSVNCDCPECKICFRGTPA